MSVEIQEIDSDHEGALTLLATERDAAKPLGLALAKVTHPEHLEVESVLVQPEHRRRGVAKALLVGLEEAARRRGKKALHAMFDARSVSEAVPKLLAGRGFTKPLSSMLLLCASRKICEAPWMRLPLPEGYRIVRRVELDPRHLEAVRGATWYPPALGPEPEEPIDPVASIALLRVRADDDPGELVGWVITERTADDELRYNRLFVREDHRARAMGIALLAQAIWRQEHAGIPYGTFAVRTDNDPMLRVLERRLMPWVESIREPVLWTKDLPPT